MSLTQFAMVEELACLIKDNLPCKHLVLSIEEALVDFLKDDTSSDGVLELEPMNSYNRLLLHRLADIFGFSHQSVGEGDDRHLIFERCPDTSVPSILVSDLLWQYDEIQSPSMSHLLSRRLEVSPELEKKRGAGGGGRGNCEIISLEERETAYLAARERIFSMEEQVGPPPRIEKKPQSDPVVARRMIAHALGQKMPQPVLQNKNTTTDQVVVGKAEEAALKQQQEATDKGKTEISQKDHLKEQQQHIGAAKRMFANALGFQPTRHNHHQALVTKTTKRGSPD